MEDLFWLALGCAAGGMARHWLSGIPGRAAASVFPWATLAVNASGALGIGVLAGAAAAGHPWFSGPGAWRVLAVGFLGSYTTVSSFSLQTLVLAQTGARGRAAGNVVLSLGLCLGLVAGAALAV
jgi:CrcB protein